MTNDGLKIIHFNTQGFQNKVNSINKFVKLHDPDILVVTEHFQKNKDDLEKIDGYKIVNSFCRKHNERGGVAIWAKNEIPCTPRVDLDKHRKEREFELVSVSVGGDIVITGAYRPPDTSIVDFHDNLARYLKRINQEPNVKHVLTGDFNIDNSKHNSTRNVLKDHNLTFNITKETHRDGGCIDNFITNFKNSKSRVIKSKSSKFSDHSPIELIVEKEVTMIAKKQESLLWRIIGKLLFFKKEEPIEKESGSLKKKTILENESCKTIFNKVYHYIFNGTCNDIDNSKNKIKRQKIKINLDEVSGSGQPKSLFSKIQSYFTSETSDSSSRSSNFRRKNSSKNYANDVKSDSNSGEKSESIFMKIINFFR